MFKRAARYQNGSLTIQKGKGTPKWIFRWRESTPDGKKAHRSRLIGTKTEYPTKRDAMKAVEGLRLDIKLSVSGGCSQLLTCGRITVKRSLRLTDSRPQPRACIANISSGTSSLSGEVIVCM
jgi:hypothetical protein